MVQVANDAALRSKPTHQRSAIKLLQLISEFSLFPDMFYVSADPSGLEYKPKAQQMNLNEASDTHTDLIK